LKIPGIGDLELLDGSLGIGELRLFEGKLFILGIYSYLSYNLS